MKNTKKGFTLIELLVVIAIIGILSSIVLVSLSTARQKGKAAAAKGGMASLRSQVELIANGGSYGAMTGGNTSAGATTACVGSVFGDTSMTPIITNISQNAYGTATGVVCSSDSATAATKWSASILLPDGTGSYCVDSSGNVSNLAGKTTIDTTVQALGACK